MAIRNNQRTTQRRNEDSTTCGCRTAAGAGTQTVCPVANEPYCTSQPHTPRLKNSANGNSTATLCCAASDEHLVQDLHGLHDQAARSVKTSLRAPISMHKHTVVLATTTPMPQMVPSNCLSMLSLKFDTSGTTLEETWQMHVISSDATARHRYRDLQIYTGYQWAVHFIHTQYWPYMTLSGPAC